MQTHKYAMSEIMEAVTRENGTDYEGGQLKQHVKVLNSPWKNWRMEVNPFFPN